MGGTEWQVHLNPTVVSDISARSHGGNVKINVPHATVAHISADTGGGDMEIVLPDHVMNLQAVARTGGGNVTVDIGGHMTGNGLVEARSGAGNVVVHVPGGLAARIHAESGLGKVYIDSHFNKTDAHTYTSANFDSARG